MIPHRRYLPPLVLGTITGLALAPRGLATLADPVALLLALAASGAAAVLWVASRRPRRRALDGLYRARRLAAWRLHCALERRRARAAERAAARLFRPRVWPMLRGCLATVGAVTVFIAAAQAGMAVVGPSLRKLFGAHATCTLRSDPPDESREATREANRHRNLKTFANLDYGDGDSE